MVERRRRSAGKREFVGAIREVAVQAELEVVKKRREVNSMQSR